MTNYLCPVEGCEYGKDEEKTANQVLGHLGSKADHPNPTDINDPLPQREDVDDDRDDDRDDDQDDQNDQDDDRDDDQDDDMPTQEEYEQQQQQAQNPEGDDDQDDDQDGGGFTTPDLSHLGISDNMMLLGVLLLVILAIGYLVYSGDESTQDVTEDVDDEGDELEGGLIG